ncbi:MAG: hypothetical protein H2172_10420 [Opitutus sp.]|nr:hypothetical protein [Opitutus sp.]MCS6275107.1 hypothetical protein [Opitutus sp.]MCS6276765.1 hypothetical protein [Opitutus sp.]MCS6301586.1 hypothetical protein [Opitutus sp.]
MNRSLAIFLSVLSSFVCLIVPHFQQLHAAVADQPINVPVKFAAQANVPVDTRPVQVAVAFYSWTNLCRESNGYNSIFYTACSIEASINGKNSGFISPAGTTRVGDDIMKIISGGPVNVTLNAGQTYDLVLDKKIGYSYPQYRLYNPSSQYGEYGVVFSAPPVGYRILINDVEATEYRAPNLTGDYKGRPASVASQQIVTIKVRLEQINFAQTSVTVPFYAKSTLQTKNSELPWVDGDSRSRMALLSRLSFQGAAGFAACNNSVTLAGLTTNLSIPSTTSLSGERVYVSAAQSPALNVNTDYVLSLASSTPGNTYYPGSHSVVFTPPLGYRILINGVAQNSINYENTAGSSYTVRVERINFLQPTVIVPFFAQSTLQYKSSAVPTAGGSPSGRSRLASQLSFERQSGFAACNNSVSLAGLTANLSIPSTTSTSVTLDCVSPSQSPALNINTDYVLNVASSTPGNTYYPGNHFAVFTPPIGYRILINGVTQNSINYGNTAGSSYTVRVEPTSGEIPTPYYEGALSATLNGVTVNAGGKTSSIATDMGSSFVEIGRRYTFSLAGTSITGGEALLSPPPGYRLQVDGVLRNAITFTGTTKTATIVVLPPEDGFSGAAGTCSSILGGQVKWSMALGSQKNGTSAGALSLIGAGLSDWAYLYTPDALYYDPVDSQELQVYRPNGITPRQIQVNEAFVDIVTTTATSYEVRVYSPAQVLGANFPKTFSGQPFVLYRVAQEAGSSTKLKITKETRESATSVEPCRTEYTTIERTGTTTTNFRWTVTDWTQVAPGIVPLRVETRQWGSDTSNSTVGHTETIETKDEKGKIVASASRVHTQFPWGDTPTSTTLGDTAPITTTFEYNNLLQSPGSYGFASSKVVSGGNWESYAYFPTTDYKRVGTIKQVFRPFGDAPATPIQDATLCSVTTYDYDADAFGMLRRLKSEETRVAGNLLSKSSVAYATSAANGMTLVTATRSAWADSAGANLVSVTKYYQEDVADTFFRSQPHAVISPDGSKQAYLRQLGDYTSGTFTAGGGKTASRIGVINGMNQAVSGGALLTDCFGYTIDPIYVVTDKSTLSLTVRDAYARVVREETYVWHDGGWQLVTHQTVEYDWANKVKTVTSSNGELTEVQFLGDLRQWERDATGIKQNFSYDGASRLQKVTKESVGGRANIITEYGYDALNHVTTQKVYAQGKSEAVTASWSYDRAGRLSSSTPPRQGTTFYRYDPAQRQTTTELPDHATQIETRYLDGSLKSITGTAVVGKFYSYAVPATGGFTSVERIASADSLRYTKSTADLLGRTLTVERPGPPNQPVQVLTHSYDSSTGKLFKTVTPGQAPTLYTYDELGAPALKGLDVDRNGQLTAASTDRISGARSRFQLDGGSWWVESTQYAYLKASDATEAMLQRQRQRLTGFPADGTRTQSESYDVEGNKTTSVVKVNRATQEVTTTTTQDGLSNSATTLYRNGLRISSTGIDQLTTTLGYDDLERLQTVTDPRTGSTTTTYYDNSTQVKDVTDAANYKTSFGYDDQGRRSWTQNPKQLYTRQDYTPRGEVWRQWGDSTNPVAFGYDDYGQQSTLTTYRAELGWTAAQWPAGPLASGDQTSWNFDPASGVLLKKTDAKGVFVEFDYDANGALWHRYSPRTLPNSTTRVQTTYGYDADTGEIRSRSYNDSLTTALAYTYYRTGELATVTDATGQRTFGDGANTPWRETYEDLPAYYQSRRLTALYEEATATATSTMKGRSAGFSLGTSASPASLLTQSYKFNSYARLEQVGLATGTAAAQWLKYQYEPKSPMIRSVQAVGTDYTHTRTYEPNRDLLASITTQWGAATRTKHSYANNSLGQRDSVLQDGDAFADYGATTHRDFKYGDRGELKSATDYLGALTDLSRPFSARKFSYEHDAAGNRTADQRTADASTRSNYQVNSLNQLDQRTTPGLAYLSGTAALGAPLVLGDTAPMRQGRYWEGLFPLANQSGPVVTTVPVRTAQIGQAVGGGDLVTVQNKAVSLAPAAEVIQYDAAGNLWSDGRWDYTWDAEDRLAAQQTNTLWALAAGGAATRLEYTYDYQSRRVGKKVYRRASSSAVWQLTRELRFIYLGWKLVAETDAAGALQRSYGWGLDFSASLADGGPGALLQITDHTTAQPRAYLPAHDGNGNVSALLARDDGSVAASYEYSPAGGLERATGSYALSNPFRFAGQYMDDETGLLYYGYRYYDSRNGRFINRDPAGEAGGLNLHGIAGGDTVNGGDSLGLAGWYPSTVTLPPLYINAKPLPFYIPPPPPRPTYTYKPYIPNISNALANQNRPAAASGGGTGLGSLVTNGASVSSANASTAAVAPATPAQPYTQTAQAPQTIDTSSGQLGSAPNNFSDHNAFGNSPVHHTYHSLLIEDSDGRGSRMASRLFQALRTFEFFNKGDIAKVALNASGSRAFFSPNGTLKEFGLKLGGKLGGFGAVSPVSLSVDSDSMSIRAETQNGHFLVGVRHWGVEVLNERSPARVRIYSEAYEQIMFPASFMEGAFKKDQMAVWRDYLINTAIGSGFGPNLFSSQGVAQQHEIEGSGLNPFFARGDQ